MNVHPHGQPFDPTVSPTRNRPHNDVAFDNDTARLDAVAKVTGRAKFSIDQVEGDPLIAAFVRCPWGRAELVSVDLRAARAVPGVVLVDMQDNVGETFTYHGQHAGAIAAENVTALRRGLRALNPQWRRLDAIPDLDAAAPDDFALTTDEQRGLDAALADADFILDAVYATQVQTHSALETHGARVEHLGDRAVVYGSTQSNFGFRDGLTGRLGLPAGSIEMNCRYVGGGFGAKFGPGKEGHMAAIISERLRRPVIVFCDRREEHLDTGNRPSSRQHYRLGVKGDGTLLGGAILTWGGVGVGGRGGGVSGQRYNFGPVVRKHQDVSFNAGAPRAFRAPGHPQAMFAAELAMEELATAIDMDPVAFRKNHDPSRNRHRMFDIGAEMIGWNRREPTGSQTGAIRRGLGVGVTDWGASTTVAEAEVVIHPDASVEVRSGTQDIGTGQKTLIGVVAAHRLGIPLRFVEAKVGSTNLPVGPASGGSVTAPNTAPAVIAASLDAKEKLLRRVGGTLGVEPATLDIADGAIIGPDGPLMTWTEACAALGQPIVGRGRSDRQNRQHHGEGHSDGVQFVEVLVDAETGLIRVERVVAIQACGKVVCRKTAESQIIGGVIQGISYALFEDRILDRRTAAMVNPNLEWYKIAGSKDTHEIVPMLWDDGSTGVRSLGEPPTIPTAGAIACAVYNAIGVPVCSLPLTPDRVLAALNDG